MIKLPQFTLGVEVVTGCLVSSVEDQNVVLSDDTVITCRTLVWSAGVKPETLAGKHVLIVDDILDSGTTIRRIRGEIEQCAPKEVKACVLLRKTIPSALQTPCEFVGFDIPDVFVVGYGLDYDDYYRNLPDIGVLKPEAL